MENAEIIIQRMLDSYKNIPRDADKEDEDSEEVKAIKNLRELLDYMEKRLRGVLSDKDKAEIRKSADNWKKSISVLKNYIEEERN